MKKFPNVIHVTREDAGSPDEWLQVHRHGVSDVDEHGQSIAIYKLVEVGVVTIQKSFTKPAKKRT